MTRRSSESRNQHVTERRSGKDRRWRISIDAIPVDRSSPAEVELAVVEVDFYGDHLAVANRLMDDFGLRREHWVLKVTVKRRGSMPSQSELVSMIEAHSQRQDKG